MRHLAIVRISPECLITRMRPGMKFVVTETDIPADAEVRNVAYDDILCCIKVLLEHASFPEVEDGMAVTCVLKGPTFTDITNA